MPNRDPTPARAALCTGAAVAAAYTVLFLALFAQFPRAGRVPGNCDTWYAIAFTNLYRNQVKEVLGLGHYGTFLYPVTNPFAYGETSAALAVVPMLLRALGLGDVGAYYVFVSLAYAATAFGTYLFATLYVRRRLAAALAGLVLAASNFLLSTIDSPHTAFFGLAFLALYFFKRHLLFGRDRDLWCSAVLAGAQVYVSSYVFLLLAIACLVLLLANAGEIVRRPGGWARMAAHAGVVGLLAAPFFVFYFLKLTDYFNWRPQAVLFAEFNSLDPQDLLSAMPGNLLYPEGHRFDHRDAVALQRRIGRPDPAFRTEDFAHMTGASPRHDEESLWVSSRRRAFIGIVPYLLALAGAAQAFAGRRELLALFGVGFVIALGPLVSVGGVMVPMPLYALYELIPAAHVFRIPGRAFALSVLAVAVLAARGLERLLARAGATRGRTAAAVLLASAVVVVENVPFPMRSFEAAAWVEPPADYLRFFSAQPGAVILNVPSGIGYGLAGSADDLYVFNRELVYMNWQAYHGQSIVNGVNGYIPRSRIAVQRLIARLPSDLAVAGLARLGVGYIAFNKGLVLPGEAALLPRLRRASTLEAVLDAESTVVFRIRP
jgi:hypothetical protein